MREFVNNSEKPLEGASRYREYKHSTDAVLQWGQDTWRLKFEKRHKKNKKKPKHRLRRNDGESLVAKIAKLQQLSEAGGRMPESVYKQLRIAVKLREAVSKFYARISTTSEEAFERHEWVITQLRNLLDFFFVADPKSQSAACDSSGPAPDDDEKSDVEVDVAVNEPREKESAIPTLINSPTREQLAEEDRCFAVACALSEIEDIRSDACRHWREWVMKDWTDNDEDEVGEFVTISVFSAYCVKVVEKTVLQTSLEHDAFDEFEKLLVRSGSLENSIEPCDRVCDTISALKDIHDIVRSFDFDSIPMDMYGIDFYNYGDDAKKHKREILQQALADLDEYSNGDDDELVPTRAEHSVSEEAEEVPPTTAAEVKNRGCCRKDIEDAMARKDISAFTRVIVKKYFPIWISFGHSRRAKLGKPDQSMWSADYLFVGYLLEFEETKKIPLHFSFLLLVLADSCFEQYADPFRAEAVQELICRQLDWCFDEDFFEMICSSAYGEEKATENFIMESANEGREYMDLWLPMIFPLSCWSGCLFIGHLALYLSACLMRVLLSREDFLCLVHLYRMLRLEGYLERIDDIEDHFIRIFNKEVFFRAGLPRAGQYASNFQLALGACSANVVESKGRRRTKGGNVLPINKHMGVSVSTGFGLNVHHISKLMGIMLWRSVPGIDREECFDTIRDIVFDECNSLYMSNLMDCAHTLDYILRVKILPKCVHHADKFLLENGLGDVVKGSECHRVTFLGTNLADLSSDSFRSQKLAALSLLAHCFAKEFKVSVTNPNLRGKEEIKFAFNSYQWSTNQASSRSEWMKEGKKRKSQRAMTKRGNSK